MAGHNTPIRKSDSEKEQYSHHKGYTTLSHITLDEIKGSTQLATASSTLFMQGTTFPDGSLQVISYLLKCQLPLLGIILSMLH